MEKNKFSIIVPVYNCERYLEKCIKSIINQEYKNIELILVNDGSKDKSGSICKKYSNIDSRILYIEQINSGVSIARNKGIETASGNYITFVDADDYIEKTTLKRINEKVEALQCDIFKYCYIKETKLLKRKYRFSIEQNKKIIKSDYKEKIIPYVFKTFDLSNVWNAVYKKELFSGVRFDENLKYGEDFKFMIETLLKSKSIYINSDILYHYVYNKNSAINGKNTMERMIDNIISCLDIQKMVESSNLQTQNLKQEVNYRIQNAINMFCMQISQNRNYDEYVQEIEKLIENKNFIKIQERYNKVFKQSIQNELLKKNYYNKIKRDSLKTNIKNVILNFI